MTSQLPLFLAVLCAAVAVVYGAISTKWILALPDGNDRMRSIAAAIQEGATAYLNRQYRAIALMGGVLFLAIGVFLDWATAIGFAIGAIFPPRPDISE